ncbi:MAG TPA: vitamin B12-dependent ribonucleotide reductase [Candidatus Limnocylindrales bacterium]|nr:vitamin B12-dependent ribonucleotide reductase [Candidatus Limnocylindrales bacterium]
MARATGAPTPVMTDNTTSGVTAAKGKAGGRATATNSSTTNSSAATKSGETVSPGGAGASSSPGAAYPGRNLGGPWGASFIGLEPSRTDGKLVHGLSWTRRHTTAGIHPYDEIEWELRTAAISSETGKTVFEQKDVEVPKAWSQLATNVVVSKYFRGHVGTPERETSVRQLIDRVVNSIAAWAETQHYFATDEDLRAFQAELTHLLVHQKMAFNSPVWFNVGIEPKPQCSACFINSVQDNMGSIMDLAKTEAMLFKFGSGAGSNLSPIRSSRERMSGGGIASGPVSFMKGYDAFAGVIKSGGKTRRAAKMVILDADHPDVLEFIDSKMLEEKKAWALIEQGYDPSFTGEAYGSVFFQNANHSVRVTDTFMRAVETNGDWTTHAIVTGEPVETLKARDIFRRMADAAWICGDPGIQYDTTINDWHTSANTDRIYASNPCSEYMFLDDTACNLASLNLMKFVKADGEFDVEDYRYAARLTITAQEILVDNASYPTPRIEENSHKFRPLGLGYANLGALLMSRGLAYDSDEGRNFAAALTAIMHGEAYRQSSVVARDHGGAFAEYDRNRNPFLRVIRKHRDAAYQLPSAGVPRDLQDHARKVFDEALELGEQYGYRNAQVTVLAPTGTIAFMMDCDTTGIEPDIALIKYKKLVGEGYLKIVNQTVPAALRKLGYQPDEVSAIVEHVNSMETIEGAPSLKPEHLPVFDCAFKPVNGQRSIHYMGHVRMMGAVQPFISGAISKTVNMPEAATAEEIESVYLEGWKQGLKAIAIYRDGSKRSQPLSTGKKKDVDTAAVDSELVAELKRQLAAAQVEAGRPHRRRLPAERTAVTHKFDIAGHEGYITVGLYPDGQPGEIFLKMAKEGSTVSGLMDSFATTVSVALQYGVPLKDLVNKFAHVRFEPSGFTGNSEIPIAKSIVDYIFRWLGSRFMSDDDKANLGLIDRSMTEAPVAGVLSGSVSAPLGAATPAASGRDPLAESTPAPATPADTGASTAVQTDQPRASAADAVQTVAIVHGHPQPIEPAPSGEGQELTVIATNGALNGHANGHANGHSNGAAKAANGGGITLNLGGTKVAFAAQADAPSCADCGSIMVRNGSCYKCLNCGSTSGCS